MTKTGELQSQIWNKTVPGETTIFSPDYCCQRQFCLDFYHNNLPDQASSFSTQSLQIESPKFFIMYADNSFEKTTLNAA